MSTLTLIDLKTGLTRSALTAHEHIGFELGWDYAHYRVTPPAPYAQEPSPLCNGLLAGRAAFGLRTLAANRHVRKWLQLRLHAWLRGRSVELMQVTPNHLQQIDVSHCPITRVALSSATLSASDASIDRVRNDAGYVAGNLAVMSTAANHAKAAHGHTELARIAEQVEGGDLVEPGGLDAAAWARLVVLASFVQPLPHDEACAVPMRVLPPNRLRLFNPVQALQAFVSRQWLAAGWSRRLAAFEDMLPGEPLKRDFKAFVMALLPRIIEAGRRSDAQHARWAVEDAWRAPLVQQRWAAFARQLTAAQCEALVARAAKAGLANGVMVSVHDDGAAAATDGWALETRGYVPHAAQSAYVPHAQRAMRAAAQAQQQFAW